MKATTPTVVDISLRARRLMSGTYTTELNTIPASDNRRPSIKSVRLQSRGAEAFDASRSG
jgi:hypothetical protein